MQRAEGFSRQLRKVLSMVLSLAAVALVIVGAYYLIAWSAEREEERLRTLGDTTIATMIDKGHMKGYYGIFEYQVNGRNYQQRVGISRFDQIGEQFIVFYMKDDPTDGWVDLSRPAFLAGLEYRMTEAHIIGSNAVDVRYEYDVAGTKYQRAQQCPKRDCGGITAHCRVHYLVSDPRIAILDIEGCRTAKSAVKNN